MLDNIFLADSIVCVLAFICFVVIFLIFKANKASYDSGYDEGYSDCLNDLQKDLNLEYKQGYEDGYADGSRKAAYYGVYLRDSWHAANA